MLNVYSMVPSVVSYVSNYIVNGVPLAYQLRRKKDSVAAHFRTTYNLDGRTGSIKQP